MRDNPPPTDGGTNPPRDRGLDSDVPALATTAAALVAAASGGEAALVGCVVALVVAWLLLAPGGPRWRRRKHVPEHLPHRRSGRYGLLDAASDSDDQGSGVWDAVDLSYDGLPRGSVPGAGTDGATARALAALARSPAFAAHLRARKLTRAQAAEAQRRLEVYKELREVDPASFRALVRTPPTSVDARPPPALLSATDLAAGPAGAGAAALAALLLPGAPSQVRAAGRAAAASAMWWLAWALLGGRSPLPGGLCWEDAAWGTPATPGRLAAAAAVDAVYGAGTLGLGFAISLFLRLWRGGQSVGERAAGVRLVREVVEPAEVA